METNLPAADMLEILPYMSREEKKQLYKKLKEERDEEASWQLFKKGTPEKVSRPDKKKEGYTAASSSTTPAPEPAAVSTLPEPVRKKRLKEFRRALYEGALDRKGRVKPSEASELPTPEQDRCKHPWEKLRWGANGAAQPWVSWPLWPIGWKPPGPRRQQSAGQRSANGDAGLWSRSRSLLP